MTTTTKQMGYPVGKRMTLQVMSDNWPGHAVDDIVLVTPEDMVPASEVDTWSPRTVRKLLNGGFIGPPVPAEIAAQSSSTGTMANGGDGSGVAVAAGFPRHHGGPWYELSTGERVKGRTAAMSRQAAIDVFADGE